MRNKIYRAHTIETEFDPGILPRWARKHGEVVALCENDLAFRCDVFCAKHADYRKALIRKAKSKRLS